MKGWRVFESMKWNYHQETTTSKIRKVGTETSLIYVWPPLSIFFLGFDGVFIEDLYLYNTSRVFCHFLRPFFGRVTAKLVKTGQTYGTTVIVFLILGAWAKETICHYPDWRHLFIERPQPDASLSIKELDGSAGAVIDFGSCSNLYRHWLRHRYSKCDSEGVTQSSGFFKICAPKKTRKKKEHHFHLMDYNSKFTWCNFC